MHMNVHSKVSSPRAPPVPLFVSASSLGVRKRFFKRWSVMKQKSQVYIVMGKTMALVKYVHAPDACSAGCNVQVSVQQNRYPENVGG